MKQRLLPLLLAGMMAVPAFATDYYVGEKGGALNVDVKGARTVASFNLGQDGFAASGIRHGNRVVLDLYDNNHEGVMTGSPSAVMDFDGAQVNVTISAKNEHGWQDSVANGRFHQLDYAHMASGLRADSGRFAKAEKRMNDALESLLSATPESRREAVTKAQADWMTKVDQRTQIVIMYSDLPEQKKISKTISHGYAAVFSDRTKVLDELTKQAKDPKYVPTLKGVITTAYEDTNVIGFIPEGYHSSIFLCKSGTPSCRQADKLLEGEMEVDVKVTGRLEPVKGYVQQGLKVRAK